MVSKKTVNTLLASAVALTVAGAGGIAAADTMSAPANPNLLKVEQNGCQGKNGCEGKMDEAHADTPKKEKCYGVVKAGNNDCGSADGAHSCAGQAAADNDPNEWVAVPAGLCDKLAGGTTEPNSGGADADHGHEH